MTAVLIPLTRDQRNKRQREAIEDKLNERPRRRARRLLTPRLLRQRELSWALCITEAYIGGLSWVAAVGSILFTRADRAVVREAIEATEVTAAKLRRHLRALKEQK